MLRAAVPPVNICATRFTARRRIGFASADGAIGIALDRPAVATRLLVHLSSPALRVAIGSRFADASGKYIQSHNGQLIEARSSKVSYDEAVARKLWADSEMLVHLRPEEKTSMRPGLKAVTRNVA
jgi:hypothetical protein